MRITPLDIRKQEFRKAMRGLDADEVYAFLSTVGDEYESILNDNKALRERLLELDDKVQEYRKMEKTLRDTLLTAERVTLEAKENARREAGLIIKEAQIEAEKALRDISSDAMNLRQEVSQLRGQRESYLGRMKVIAESLLRFIENVETDFRQEDEAFGVEEPAKKKDNPPPARESESENEDLFESRPEPRVEKTTRETGVPSHFQRGRETGSDVASAPDPRHLADGPPETDRPDTDRGVWERAAADDPVVGDRMNTQEPRAGSERHDPVTGPGDDGGTDSTLSNINDIIERMADGQKEIISGETGGGAGEPVRGLRDGQQFEQTTSSMEPQPPRKPEVQPGRPWDAPRPGKPVTGDTLETAPPQRPLPVAGAWENEPEVATALEKPPTELPDREAETRPGTKVPTGTSVTSEMSLEEIRRDLEKRIAREKEENRRDR